MNWDTNKARHYADIHSTGKLFFSYEVKRSQSGPGRLENPWSKHLTLRGAERAARRWTKLKRERGGEVIRLFTEAEA